MCLVYCFLFILNFEWKFDLPQTYKWLLQESQSLEDTVCFRQNDIKIKCNIKMWSSAAAAGWMYDPWEQTAADAFCSTHLLMLTFSKQPVPTGTSDDKTKMAVRATKWRLFLLTPCILKPAAVFSVDCSETFHIFKIEMDSGRGRHQHKGQCLTFSPRGEQCQGNDVTTTVALIPMKITGWQGGCQPCLPRPLTHRQLQVIRARRHAAVVCGNCKLLLKSPGEWL